MLTQDGLIQFNNDKSAWIADKSTLDMFIDNKFTQLILETFNWLILDVILYTTPVDDIFVHDIPILFYHVVKLL